MGYDAYFSICGMNPRQIMYASQSSSEVCIKSPEGDIKGFVVFSHCHYDNKNKVLYIATTSCSAAVLQKYSNHQGKATFKVEFKVKHSYFKNLTKSVNLIHPETIRRIVPSESDFQHGRPFHRIPRSPFRVNQLDTFQLRALRTMLFSKSTAPVLVPGPFGTGKTRLLSVASEYFITNAKYEGKLCRILLCCHQQDSADIFMRDYFLKMLRDKQYPWNAEVLRVVSQTHQKKQSNEYEISFDNFRSHQSQYCSFRHIVFVTTFMTALRMAEIIPQSFFTHILIDEGAQAREPECIAPLCMANEKTRIVIAGDYKQVGIPFFISHVDQFVCLFITIGWPKISCLRRFTSKIRSW